jgi:hypothetical protein
MIEIKHCITGEIIYSTEAQTVREAVEKAIAEGVSLSGADLREAKLSWADLDFSCLPLWCGSFGMQVDSRFVRQLAAHLYRLKCDEPEGQAIQRLLRPARNAFCRDRDDVREVE